MTARATSYKGFRFSSREEAQWAAFLDVLSIEWKRGQSVHGPAFWLPSRNVFIAVVDDQTWDAIDTIYPADGIATWASPVDIGENDHTWAGNLRDLVVPSRTINHSLNISSGHPIGGIPLDWGQQLACPVCDFPYVHFSEPVYVKSDDTWGSAWIGRGDAIKIPMYCESGHRWVLRYGFHKGHIFRAVEDVQFEDRDLTLWLADWDEDKRRNAIRAISAIHWGRSLPPSLRFRIFKRDKYRCQICGRSADDGVKLEVDHKIAWANGGGNDIDNLWTLCNECNAGKSDKEL
jgi:hypothetical protein